MDQEKLVRLRAKYGDAKGMDVTRPSFKRVIDLIFRDDGVRAAPYSGISTFLGAPQKSFFDGLDVAIVGVPMDLGVTNRAGARLGPRAVRGVERIGPYHHVHDITPFTMLNAADVGDVPFRSRFSLEMSIEDIERYFLKLHAQKVRPLAVGGDHSITYPILKALGKDRPLALIHFDAHCDTGGEFDHSKFHHGGPFRQAVLAGVLDPDRTIQIGIRGSSEFLWEFSHEAGMTVLHMEDVEHLGCEGVIAAARKVVGDNPTYVSFDVDGLDPVFAPGTGTPEVGGLSSREALTMLRGLKGLHIVGGDVVEVAPQYDATTVTAQMAAQVLFEELALLALAPKA